MSILQCPHCKKHARFMSRDLRGEWWNPIRLADCKFCNREYGVAVLPGVASEQVKAEVDADKKLRAAGDSRLFVTEYWLQVFLREKATDYGLKIVEPIRPKGPDFIVSRAGKPTLLEVEVRWDDYLKHRHHLDERFAKRVTILAVLCPDPPVPTLRPLLPKEIIFLRPDDFLEWRETEGDHFEREIAELEVGQHTSYQRSQLDERKAFLLRLQPLARRIEANAAPDCTRARDELVQVLSERNDDRAEKLAAWELPLTSRLVDMGLLDDSQLTPALREKLDALFPERHEIVDLKTRRTFKLRPLKGRRRKNE